MFGSATPDLIVDRTPLTCVCCSCHRERTPEGEWCQRSRDVGERVTHGICPTCFVTLYPEYAYLQDGG